MSKERPTPASAELTLDALVAVVGAVAFEAACAQAMSTPNSSMQSDVPHDLSDRLWYEGDESLEERLSVAVELYRRMPCYANLMYWRHREFDERTGAQMWQAYREFLGDTRESIADPVAYSLWVDYFEDQTTVDRAWREVAGPQEPRRPRLERVVAASGPVPWASKAALYERLAIEGGWDEPLIAGLYGSCIDLYGSLDRQAALRILQRVKPRTNAPVYPLLRRALEDPRLPNSGADRRAYVAKLARTP